MIPAASLLMSLVDAAARSLLLAATVGLGLRMLRVRNVVAQKAAWILVLTASLLMPLVAPWAEHAAWLPASSTLLISARRWTSTQPDEKASPAAVTASANLMREASEQAASRSSIPPLPAATIQSQPSPGDRFPAPAQSQTATDLNHAVSAPAKPPAAVPPISPAPALFLLYLAVCGVLLIRLAYGAWRAARLWLGAEPVALDVCSVADAAAVRSSTNIVSPVTIGAGIVLPADYSEWDTEKLRIVVAHEGSHVRQWDFYVQLAASLYVALFWFSPLGWILKRRLSDLGETISDGSAVREAASHASYAKVLLEFAAMPRPIPIGVAMAHHGHLRSRIEHLLNESHFRQAFSGGRVHLVAAVLLVPVALFASTAMVRVHAADQQTPPPATAPEAPVAAPEAPSAAPNPAPAPQAAGVPAAQAPAAPAMPDGQAAPPAPPAGTPAIPGQAPQAPTPGDNDVIVLGPGFNPPVISITPRAVAPYTLKLPNAKVLAAEARTLAILDAQMAQPMVLNGQGFRFAFGSDGNSYAYVTGEGDKNVHYSGNWFDSSREEIDKARKVAHGDFLWFEHDGKSYVIDDPAVLAALKPMQDSMDTLGKQQEDLGKQQEELGRQQEALGRKQQEARVPTPDVSKEMADINAGIAKLNAQKGGTVSQEDLADLQGKIAELQGKLGSIEGEIGGKQGEIGRQQGELGRKQGELGRQQGRLGQQQGRIAREMDGKILTIIDECLKDGKARPVE
jgi:beta-lactamase regulating signal transducer with metallopeptidase domain